ncbi:hypothetical protein L2E82_38443 [Cichorium intybus]|uniref:Uncharacterized protein n=1 Tax=Cichorium intybus TaxID=13427 RepID=A0ACB9AH12_CICIN|nr:hypothetical protein L2E82_38443 [Cichorium intybus]
MLPSHLPPPFSDVCTSTILRRLHLPRRSHSCTPLSIFNSDCLDSNSVTHTTTLATDLDLGIMLNNLGNEKLVACGARVRKVHFPVNEGIEERLQDVKVEQTLRGHRNTTYLLESGYSKDERILRLMKELKKNPTLQTNAEIEKEV